MTGQHWNRISRGEIRYGPQVLKELYDREVLSEESLLKWADEKKEATEEERVFLNKAAPLIQWLRTAESDEEGDEEDDDTDAD